MQKKVVKDKFADINKIILDIVNLIQKKYKYKDIAKY